MVAAGKDPPEAAASLEDDALTVAELMLRTWRYESVREAAL
ncbi:hypothetical protein ACPOL_3815 [Acidisarcina polymorpha]|uniref:Uncharacterized protein n=1 Tax=Acidisarcina polymorpha TaxID=2211140 RepID=A0A2Z5G2R0_9BACT|nr:hypothetical protein ACPOL_3815 [Acidisarcina polymorpha]